MDESDIGKNRMTECSEQHLTACTMSLTSRAINHRVPWLLRCPYQRICTIYGRRNSLESHSFSGPSSDAKPAASFRCQTNGVAMLHIHIVMLEVREMLYGTCNDISIGESNRYGGQQ